MTTMTTRNEGKGIMDKTYLVKIPNGEIHEVNVFDFNVAVFCDPEKYIQLAGGGWIKIKNITLIEGA